MSTFYDLYKQWELLPQTWNALVFYCTLFLPKQCRYWTMGAVVLLLVILQATVGIFNFRSDFAPTYISEMGKDYVMQPVLDVNGVDQNMTVRDDFIWIKQGTNFVLFFFGLIFYFAMACFVNWMVGGYWGKARAFFTTDKGKDFGGPFSGEGLFWWVGALWNTVLLVWGLLVPYLVLQLCARYGMQNVGPMSASYAILSGNAILHAIAIAVVIALTMIFSEDKRAEGAGFFGWMHHICLHVPIVIFEVFQVGTHATYLHGPTYLPFLLAPVTAFIPFALTVFLTIVSFGVRGDASKFLHNIRKIWMKGMGHMGEREKLKAMEDLENGEEMTEKLVDVHVKDI